MNIDDIIELLQNNREKILNIKFSGKATKKETVPIDGWKTYEIKDKKFIIEFDIKEQGGE